MQTIKEHRSPTSTQCQLLWLCNQLPLPYPAKVSKTVQDKQTAIDGKLQQVSPWQNAFRLILSSPLLD